MALKPENALKRAEELIGVCLISCVQLQLLLKREASHHLSSVC